jgi:hypothetical protein
MRTVLARACSGEAKDEQGEAAPSAEDVRRELLDCAGKNFERLVVSHEWGL